MAPPPGAGSRPEPGVSASGSWARRSGRRSPYGATDPAGQFGPHALVGDERADGKVPRPLASGLLLAVAGGGDASGKLRVGVEQGHGDAGASGHRREADRLAALLESVDGLGGPLPLDPAIGPSGPAQCRAVVSHRWCPADDVRSPPEPTGEPGGRWWRRSR